MRIRGLDRVWAFSRGLTIPLDRVEVHVYVPAERFATELDEILRGVGLREVEEGGRVEFWEANFPLITQLGQPSQIPVASTPRLYADLLALGGRGTDAAQHLRETKLGF